MSGTGVIVPFSTRLARAKAGDLRLLDDKAIIDQAKASGAFKKLLKDMGASEAESLDGLEFAFMLQAEAGRRLMTLEVSKVGGRPKKTGTKKEPVLAPLGVSKKQSSRWQKLAKLEDKNPEGFIGAVNKKREKTHREWMEGQAKEPKMGAVDDDIRDPDEYYTPKRYIEMVRELMGGIDLDPASNEIANTVVGATRYFTQGDDGLTHPWEGRVFVNWPTSKAKLFYQKLLSEIAAGRTTEAVALDPAADTSTKRFHELARKMGVCFVEGRINFEREEGATDSNRASQAFFYYGGNKSDFTAIFGAVGVCGWLR